MNHFPFLNQFNKLEQLELKHCLKRISLVWIAHFVTMKLKIVVFVLFAFYLSRAFGSCSHWKKRMEKYSCESNFDIYFPWKENQIDGIHSCFSIKALVNCEYYVSSEGEYKEFFAFDELAKRTDSNTLQIRFFTLAPNILKFVLSEKNNSDSFNARELVRHEPDFNPMGPSDIYSDRIPTIKPELNSDLGENYEFGR